MLTNVNLCSLSSWTREDASEWVLTLGMVEPSIANVARDLSQEFVNQNVTGAKIAGGLLDRGALYFAFGMEVCAQSLLDSHIRMRIVKTVQGSNTQGDGLIFIFVKCSKISARALADIGGPKCTYTRFLDTCTRETHALLLLRMILLHAHLQDMNTAQFFANVILDLNKGSESPTCYLPWSWTQQTPGSPMNKVCTDVF